MKYTPLYSPIRTLKQTCSQDFPRAPLAFKNSMTHEFCKSHYISHFATFFIDVGAETSPATGCISQFFSFMIDRLNKVSSRTKPASRNNPVADAQRSGTRARAHSSRPLFSYVAQVPFQYRAFAPLVRDTSLVPIMSRKLDTAKAITGVQLLRQTIFTLTSHPLCSSLKRHQQLPTDLSTSLERTRCRSRRASRTLTTLSRSVEWHQPGRSKQVFTLTKQAKPSHCSTLPDQFRASLKRNNNNNITHLGNHHANALQSSSPPPLRHRRAS